MLLVFETIRQGRSGPCSRAAFRSRAAACAKGIGRKGWVIGLSERSTSASARSTATPSLASQCNVGNSAKPRIKGIAAAITLSDPVIQAASSRTDILASNAKPALQVAPRPPGRMSTRSALARKCVSVGANPSELAIALSRRRGRMDAGESPSTTLWMRAASGLEVLTGLGLVLAPSLLSRLLFGSDLNAPGEATGRIAGLVMLCLAAGCWPRAAGAEAHVLVPLMALSWLAGGLPHRYRLYRSERGRAALARRRASRNFGGPADARWIESRRSAG